MDDELQPHEEFIGLYEVATIEALSIVAVVKDCLLRLNISIAKVRGQCYDGASNMTGVRRGVATLLQREQPTAYFTHCYGHSLNLAVSDTIKKCVCMKKALDTTHEITKLVKYSPRRQNIFNRLKDEISPGTVGVRVLCPTRWTVRADSMLSIIRNYSVLQGLWDEAVQIVHDSETLARIGGVAAQMKLFDFFFGLVLGECLIRHTDNLSRTLQKKNTSASEGQLTAEKTRKTLMGIRNDDNFDQFWEKVNKMICDVEVSDSILPRRRRIPRRYEDGNAPPTYDATPKDMYRRVYFEAIDLLVQAIQDRFDQAGYQVYCCMEALLLKAIRKESYSDELKRILDVYVDDLNAPNFAAQLQILSTTAPEGISNIFDVISYLQSLSYAEKELIKEVCILAKLIIVMPATNSSSERSFSAMRRVKSYLRSTMSQERLNNLMILHVHQDYTDTINLIDVANDFVCKSERRSQLFGHF